MIEHVELRVDGYTYGSRIEIDGNVAYLEYVGNIGPLMFEFEPDNPWPMVKLLCEFAGIDLRLVESYICLMRGNLTSFVTYRVRNGGIFRDIDGKLNDRSEKV